MYESPTFLNMLSLRFLLSHTFSAHLDQDCFHDRELEQEILKTRLQNPPASVLVLVGPKSSGKTRLLNHVLVDAWQESGLGAPAIYVNGREHKLDTAADLVAALVEPGASWASKQFQGPSMLADLLTRLNFSVQVGSASVALSSSSGSKGAATAAPSVKDVVKAYLEIIERYRVRLVLGWASCDGLHRLRKMGERCI